MEGENKREREDQECIGVGEQYKEIGFPNE